MINSVAYQPTGVIMEITPRVNSGGQVTMDVSQEVSEVDTSTPSTSGINSPTFTERNVTSRVVVQYGQTLGIAGLIQDNISKGNQGIPWLKDVPLLGALAGTQTNTRQRTELRARALTDLNKAPDALTLLQNDNSVDAARLRADIYHATEPGRGCQSGYGRLPEVRPEHD